MDYAVDAGERAVAELVSRIYGSGRDTIRIRERVDLNGESARALVKSRVAVRDDATAEIVGATYRNAAGTRGHVDCTEIVRDRAVANAILEVLRGRACRVYPSDLRVKINHARSCYARRLRRSPGSAALVNDPPGKPGKAGKAGGLNGERLEGANTQ